MVNDHQLVDRLRGICTAVDQTLTAEMREWAQQYADARQTANDRLRRCADFLHRGLRGEAIALADSQPPLLDTVATLDFVELPEWENLCAGYGLPRVPALQIELAQELNEAYALQEPLREPLRVYRLMALIGAPLADRIAVARELAVLDPLASPFAEDVVMLERARQRELHAVLQKAIRNPATPAAELRALRDEVASPDWTTPCDPTWATAAEQAARVRNRQDGCVRLTAMLPDIEEAHGAMDYERGTVLLTTWDATCAEHELAEVPAAILERALPLAEWVRQETQRRALSRQFDEAVAAYALALEDRVDDAGLRGHVDTLSRFGLEVPETLTQRHRQLTIERQTADHRRRRRNAVAAVAIALAVAGGTAATAFTLYRGQQARQFAAKIQAATEAGRLDEAQAAARDAAAAGYAMHPDVAGAAATMMAAQASEKRQADAFDEEVKRIGGLVDAGTLSDVNLINATHLAASDDQKIRLGNLRERYDVALRQQRDALREQARGLLDRGAALGHEMDDAALPDDAFSARQAEAVTLSGQLRDIELRVPDLAPSVDAVVARLDAAPRDRAGREARASATADVIRAAATARNDPPAFVAALNAAASAFHGDPREVLLRDAAKRNAVAWQGVADWFGVVGTLHDVLAADTGARLDVASKAIDQYVAAHPASPMNDVAGQLKTRLNAALATAGQDAVWPAGLRRTLTSRPMRDWLIVRLTGGLFYVTDAKAFRQLSNGATLKWIRAETNDPDAPAIESRAVAADELLPEHGSAPTRAPQARMSQEMLKTLDATTLQTWDRLDGDLVRTIIEARDTDPLLRATLLQQFLQRDATLGPADDADGTAAAHFLDALNDLKVGDLNWIDPTDPAATAARTRCATLLASPEATTLPARLQGVQRHRRDAAAAALADCIGCGVVLYGDDGAPHVRSASPPPASSAAWATRWSPDGTVRLAPIGTATREREVKFDPAAGPPADGTLVFFTAPLATDAATGDAASPTATTGRPS